MKEKTEKYRLEQEYVKIGSWHFIFVGNWRLSWRKVLFLICDLGRSKANLKYEVEMQQNVV